MADSKSSQVSDQPKHIVGIGASAGGLEALEQLFDNIPPDSGLAYVIVTHLSPDFKSLMSELIARYTTMPVQIVQDAMHVRKNEVYAIPPGKEMIISGGRLLLSDRTPASLNLPIDVFFRSLAAELGSAAMGIVLSGTGSDGARGGAAISHAGGLLMVQDPETAKFDGMPRAAMEVVQGSAVLPPSEMGAAIIDYAVNKQVRLRHGANSAPVAEKTDHVAEILGVVFGASNIDFSSYKATTVTRRIRHRLDKLGCTDQASYLQEVRSNPAEAQALSAELLIGVTEFFRDTEAFEALSREVIGHLVRNAGKPLRIWVPACATGQEAYSIAMLIHEHGRALGKHVDVRIFATDISQTSLEQAARGAFTAEQVEGLSAERRDRYFDLADDGSYLVHPTLRKWIVFARHNLLQDPPFTKVDLISCRNVLIYLEPAAQQKIVGLFHFSLGLQGILFLGPSETVGDAEQGFETLDGRWRIFRRIATHAAARPKTEFALPRPTLPESHGLRHRTVTERSLGLLPAYTALLDQFAPASALIGRDRELLHTFGRGRAFLRPPDGVMTLDVMNMVDQQLRAPLATAIERVFQAGESVQFENFTVGELQINLSAVPLKTAHGEYCLIVFEEAAADTEPAPRVLNVDEMARQRIEDLETEVQRTRESLQATIEEVETSNEELQSTNEELMASNEELQSTNEELHSLNEELYTVNAEYQRKNDELASLNRDVENLLAATGVGVVFVDERLIIRRFTSDAANVFNLIADDVGRNIEHITHSLLSVDIGMVVKQAFSRRELVEGEYLAKDGQWWLVRCQPYRARRGEADGAVLTTLNIDRLKQAELSAGDREKRYRSIQELSNAHVMTVWVDRDPEQQPEWEDYTGQDLDGYRDEGWLEAIHPDDRQRLAVVWQVAQENKEVHRPAPFRLWHAPTKQYRHVKAVVEPVLNSGAEPESWTWVWVDVEEVVQAEDIVRERELVFQHIINASPLQIGFFDTDQRYLYVNQVYERRWPLACTEIVGNRIDEVAPKELYAQAKPYILRALEGEDVDFTAREIPSSEGRTVSLDIRYRPFRNDDGAVVGVAVLKRDRDELLRAERDSLDYSEMLDAFFDRAPVDLVIIAPADLAIIRTTSHLAAKLGYTTSELRDLAVPDILPEISIESLTAQTQGLIDGTDRKLELQTFLLGKEGRTLDVLMTVQQQRLADRVVLSGFIEDVSDRKAIEHALRRRTEVLARSNRDLEAFAAAASHDLKEPLRKIGGFAEIMTAEYSEVLDDQGQEYLGYIAEATDRMRALVSDLLEFSAMSARSEEFRLVALNEIIQSVRDEMQEEIGEAKAQLQVGDLPNVNGDPILLRQMFYNLFSNAIKYRDKKRKPIVKIVAEAKDKADEYIDISVTDNGIGFDSEKSGEVFRPFTRLQGGQYREGNGLGLTFCKRIAELHHGTIEAKSTPGKGSSFTVHLPGRGGH